MSEVYKITNMLVTDEDIENIDKNWQNIIDVYTKTLVREKDLVIAQYLMKKQEEEIERLNNIINELEKFFQYAYDNEVRPLNDRKVSVWTICLEKLKELKGVDKE